MCCAEVPTSIGGKSNMAGRPARGVRAARPLGFHCLIPRIRVHHLLVSFQPMEAGQALITCRSAWARSL